MLNKITKLISRYLRLNEPVFYGLSQQEKNRVECVLKKNNIDYYMYFPHMGIEDPELKDTLFKLSECGYLFTDKDGNIVGKVAKLNADSNDNAELRRNNFFVVK